jgi:hypothetical protein
MIEAEFTVTGDVPVDVSVSDCVVAVFTVTLPKLRLAALTASWGLGAVVLVPLRATTAVVLPVDELLVIVICPLADPVAVGKNCTCSVTVWVGFNVTGRLPLTIVKPVPMIAAELTVTGAVPVDVNVNDCVAAVFTVTLPKLKVPVLTVKCGLGAAVLVPPKVTCAVEPVDESLLIVIWPLAVPITVGRNCTCTVTAWVGFSVTGKLPPIIVNPAPVLAAELTVTGAVPVDVRVSDCIVAVFTVTLPKLKVAALTANWGLGAAVLVPLRVTCAVEPVDELLLIVTWPLALPVAVGRNWTCKVTACAGFSVTGKLPPTIVKPIPVIAAELTVTGAVPVDVSVSDCVVAVFTVTLPKLKVAALTANWGLGAAVLVPLRVTCAVEPVDELLLIVTWPLALPITVGRNWTCNVTVWVGFSVTGKLPPTIANPAPVMVAELIVTGNVPVDANVSDCVVAVFTVTLPKLKLPALTVNCGLGAAILVPPRVTCAVEPVDELLLIVIWPLDVPVTVGRNCTCNVIDCVGFSVDGRLPPTIVKPAPEMVAELIVTGEVPVAINVSDCVVAVFTVTLPKLKVAALTVNCGLGVALLVPSRVTCALEPVDESLLIVIWPLAVPVAVGRNCTCNVIDCVGLNVVGRLPPTIVKPAPVIEAEFTFTGNVPVDVSVSDCAVAVFTVTLPKLRLAALIVNCGLAWGLATVVPVPLRVTTAMLPPAELLLIASCPLAAPGDIGSNCTCSVVDSVGFSVTGKAPPTIVKPAPVIAAEFTVTGDVPVDVSVNDCVVAVFTLTLPKLKLAAPIVSAGAAWDDPWPCMGTWAIGCADLSIRVSCPE